MLDRRRTTDLDDIYLDYILLSNENYLLTELRYLKELFSYGLMHDCDIIKAWKPALL